MTEQIDLLAVLDAVIDNFGVRRIPRTPRDEGSAESAAHSREAAETLATPRTPRTPREKQDIHESNTTSRNAARGAEDEVAHTSILFSTRSTRSTRSFEDSCGFPTPRDVLEATSATRSTRSFEDSCGFERAARPVQLSDGRWLHRFRADEIPASVPHQARELCARARACGVVLVADGHELIAVEQRRSALPLETLRALKDAAGAIIAYLRRESRARCTPQEGGLHDE